MSRPSVFIGSSSEKVDVARAIASILGKDADVSLWQHLFRVGQPTFTELNALKDRFDFAVIVITGDDAMTFRGSEVIAPRDNVIFELGLFLGSLGIDRVFAVADISKGLKIPSDYSGVTIVEYYGDRRDHDIVQALDSACFKISQRMLDLGPINHISNNNGKLFPGEMIGLDQIYDNMDKAEEILLNDLKDNPGPIRLFFNIASQNVGLSGSLFDIIESIAQVGEVDIRILHSSVHSPLFSEDRLLSLGKIPERVLASLKYVDESLKSLEARASSTLRRRAHDYPFIWRIYGLNNKLYFMPYYAKKDATKISPVLVFRKEKNSLYHTFIDWFDDVWERSAPKRVKITDITTPATPCGTALFIRWEGFHVFGIPKRDIREKNNRVRFFGLGGKKFDSSETFENCALREGNEETGGAISKLLNSDETHYFKGDGTIHSIDVIGESITPRLILEKRVHSGFGSMKKDDDAYYLIGYDATITRKPEPHREIGAIIMLKDDHLSLFKRNQYLKKSELIKSGAEFIIQDGVIISDDAVLIPHGTAAYLTRISN